MSRPLIQMTLTGADSDREEPTLPGCGFTSFYDLDVRVEAIVDRWDYELSRLRFLGDAFPCVWPNFGPGVIAAMMGAKLVNGSDTTWFLPEEEKELSGLSFACDPANTWFNRIGDIYRAGLERWEGQVQLSMTDLGGNLDILSTFRPSEKLLLDLYDSPSEVKRLTWSAHEKWFHYFDTFNRILQPINPGYSSWCSIFSSQPYYILQCDFCYMIGPDMFNEFVKPELSATCARLTNPFYHLDGPGQLVHLDSLLTIEGLKGVQWIPGAGAKDFTHWPDVYRKIRDAGKLIQVYGDITTLDALADQLGSAEGIVLMASADVSQEREVWELLAKYGCDGEQP